MSVMTEVLGVEGGDELSQAISEFDQWRAQRANRRECIPARLWERAVSLSKRHGVGRVAGLLHLSGGDVRRRLTLSSGSQPVQGAKPKVVQFVEMVAHPMVCAPASAHTTEAGRAQCVVDLVNARGLKMRVELSGSGVTGLSELCKSFWLAR